MSIRSNTPELLTALLLFAATSCAGGDAAPYGGAVVDTLASGAVRVQNTGDGLWASTGQDPWRLEEELRVGQLEGGGPYSFGSIRDVVPNPDGSFWILDSQARELRLFDSQGQHMRTVGRPGEGPGEFTGNTCAFEGANDEIWVEDSRARWQRFDREGTLLGQFPNPSNIGCGIRVHTTDGRLFAVQIQRGATPLESTSFYVQYHMNAAGELVAADTFAVPVLPPLPRVTFTRAESRATISLGVPLVHRPTAVLGSSGNWLVTPGGGPYFVIRQTLEGDTLVMASREYGPVAPPDTTRERMIRDALPEGAVLQNDFSVDQVPAVYPPFERIIEATDRTLWLPRYVAGGVLGMDVFSAEGVYLGPVDVPEDFERILVQRITGEHVYGVLRDELDVPFLVRLGIRKPR